MSVYSFEAWDTVIRELQAERDRLLSIPRYHLAHKVEKLITRIQEEWQGKR